MVGQTTQNRSNIGVQIKICSTMFLYSEERQFITAGSRLQETKLSHDKRQDTTFFNRKSNKQTERSEVFQQT